MKIVFLDAASMGEGITFDSIAQYGEFTVYDYTTPEEIRERAADSDVVIVNKVVMGKEQIDSLSQLKLICVAATGMNNIDLGYAASKGIQVKNAVNYSTESVVQATFGSLLALMTQIIYFDHTVKSGTYSKSRHFTDTGRSFSEISGKTFGIIGMGTIGKRVAQVATAFGAKVVYFSTSGTSHCKDYPSLSLEELMKVSDIVSIHAPLNDKTNNLITLGKLSLMKKSAYIANMGRGGIINEQDLVKALNGNLIAGAAIDVYGKEPVAHDHPYFNIEDNSKIILTPHIAWASVEARTLLVNKIAENIRNFVKA